MNIKNGYKVPVTQPGTFHVSWGDWQQGDDVTEVTIVHWPDGAVRVYDGNRGWCERKPCDGDNVMDYLRVVRDTESFVCGSNGYYVEWQTDPDGDRGTHRRNQDDDPQSSISGPTLVIWRCLGYDD